MNKKDQKYKVASIGKQLLSDRVYEALKSAIVGGDLAPDTRLVETEIAAQMEVSPTPVREAFKKLSVEGFVTITPWQGVRVRVFDDIDIIETYACREYLEALAAKLSARKIDSQGIKKLQQLIEKSSQAKSPTDVTRLNSEIHNLIIAYAGNARLKSLLGDIHDIILRDRHRTAYIRDRRDQIHAEHQERSERRDSRRHSRREHRPSPARTSPPKSLLTAPTKCARRGSGPRAWPRYLRDFQILGSRCP